MKFMYKMESVLIIITSVLCIILLLNVFFKLRSVLLWRVNCWFCNNNSWVKFIYRNCWTCPECEQYNGFTKDGDYNKPLFNVTDQISKTPMIFQKSPPKNGLCKMCNINQQLKVIQLANYVPMNEMNFDEEIESYKMQLEKAYKLCSPCKKVLQMKLHKEKESLLGFKLLESRTPEKRNIRTESQSLILRNVINKTSVIIAGILLILVTIECYQNIIKNKNLFSTMNNIKVIFTVLLERVTSFIKMKTLLTFPFLENFVNDDMNNFLHLDILPNSFNFRHRTHASELTQKALGGFVCLIQIIGHIWNINKLRYTIVIDFLWSVFVIATIFHKAMDVAPVVTSFIKLSSILAVLLVYRFMTRSTSMTVGKVILSPKRMKNLTNGTISSVMDDEDAMAVDTDDDVSLTKFGLHNFTDSSNETLSPLHNHTINGRSFTPRCDSIWTKPKLNSTFCVNSLLANTPSSVSDTVFVKPSFSTYQKLAKDDSDSDLDESISTLCISSPKKVKQKNNSVFSLRKFTATPNFVAPTPINSSRPLISPSKLSHSTSWVAGGYWGSEGDRQSFNINGSRSSSQSSGFESQASSMNQRNVFSHPSSREESVCGEPDRTSVLLDRFQNNCNMSNLGTCHIPQNFSRMSSPVFPQMQYNSHVHIPQPRFVQQNTISHNTFIPPQQQYVQNNMFKTPNGSGLIKLPQVNSFSSR